MENEAPVCLREISGSWIFISSAQYSWKTLLLLALLDYLSSVHVKISDVIPIRMGKDIWWLVRWAVKISPLNCKVTISGVCHKESCFFFFFFWRKSLTSHLVCVFYLRGRWLNDFPRHLYQIESEDQVGTVNNETSRKNLMINIFLKKKSVSCLTMANIGVNV